MWLLIISTRYIFLRTLRDKVACDMYNLGKMNDSKIKFRTFVLYFTERFSTTNCTFRNKNVYMWGKKIKKSPLFIRQSNKWRLFVWQAQIFPLEGWQSSSPPSSGGGGGEEERVIVLEAFCANLAQLISTK